MIASPTGWCANHRDREWRAPAPDGEVLAFHRALPGYVPTPLVELPEIAEELGVARVFAKDESERLGLPAFKALGASWAVRRALQDRPPGELTTLVTATDGNHGRAVAHFGRLLGHRASVFVPDAVSTAAVEAIRSEGARVTVVRDTYDHAVALAARAAEDDPSSVLVQDTAWPGHEQVPGWIVDGYTTLFAETDDVLRDLGIDGPDLVVVPTGVGSLLQAALAHYRSATSPKQAALLSAEPDAAACVLASVRHDRLTAVETSATVMAGLNCGTPSSLAWPLITDGLDAAITVTDPDAIRAARDLAAHVVPAGPCGGAALAAARAALTGDTAVTRRAHLGVDEDSVIVLVITEGAAANPLPEPA